MKVLFVAVFSYTSDNNSQSRGLQAAGCQVIEYNYRIQASQLGSQEARDKDIVAVCYKECPDLVLFSKCNGVHFSVVDECNCIAKTALWYMDPMSNFNQELIDKIRRCTYTFCALPEPLKESQRHSTRAYFLHEGYDSDIDKPVDAAYKYDVSFIGHCRGERGRYQRKYGFHNYTDAYNKEHSMAVAETKINLNFTEGGTSNRTYKVLAARGFLLTQTWPTMDRDFVDGKDLVTFKNEDEFEAKIKYYLNNEEERKAIAEHGYNTVQKFTRYNWAKDLLGKL
jgi:Glycosyl transferases group 1